MRVLCALAVVCLLVRVELSSGQCPADFQLVNNKCYKFSTSNAARDQAASTCQAMGARLLSPQDASQQAGVENLLRFGQGTWNHIWTSLKEEKTSWRWADISGNAQAECFTKASGSNLFELNFLRGTSFTAQSCENECRNWLSNTFRASAVTVKSCANEGAACLNGLQAACFCGNSDVPNPEPATCTTPCPLDTSLICGAPNSFYRTKTVPFPNGWASGEPKLTNGNELCMALGFGHQYKWIAKPCSTLMRYTCKFDYLTTQDACTQSGKTWFAETSLCFKISSEGFTWFEAREQCKLENGLLVQPPTGQNFRVQVSSMVGLYSGSKRNVLSDLWTQGVATELKWADGNHVRYVNFAESRPDITRGSCVALSKQSSPIPYQWDSRSCQESLPFICETASSSAITPAPTTTTTTTTTPIPTTTTTTTATTLSTASSTPPTPRPTTTTTTRAPIRTPAPATTARPVPATRPATPPPAITPTPPPAITPTPPPAITPSPPPIRTPAPATTRRVLVPATATRTPGISKTTSKFGGGQNSIDQNAAASTAVIALTLGTKIVIGIVAFVVVISIILMIVFICQRRRKESYDDNWNE